jgi:aspartate carbamoyltransferase catalytic subunit
MGVDAIIIRHGASGAPLQLSRWVKASVLNAGDGAHEHPTQALLDLYSIREHFPSFGGLRVAIVGDIAHSRVARSNVKALTKMGALVTLVGPPTLMPPAVETWGAEISHDFDEVLPKLDVVYLLRVQRERQSEQLLPSLREYARVWGLTEARVATMRPGAPVMHPGPMNEGIEISADVAHGVQSVIEEQVSTGVAVRMALLYLTMVGALP